MLDSTQRFSNRVENYVKYRPTYPPAVIELLKDECGLTRDSIIADIGSGTGILSELFLRHGCQLYAVEPNREMREAGERLLENYPNFKSVNATAEATTLMDASVDFVTAGQAFHWFDATRARAEFARILRPDGWVVLVWNERRNDATPFMRGFEHLIATRGTDYAQVVHHRFDETVIHPFFGTNKVRLKSFENAQVFDFEGLKGRTLSASYVPQPGDPNYDLMLNELAALFDAHQHQGQVSFDYDTKVFYGRLK